jgi:hypothetical protein
MGLFTKKNDLLDADDDDALPRSSIPSVQTVPTHNPGRASAVRVTGVDPSSLPAQSIERRGPDLSGLPLAPNTGTAMSQIPPIPSTARFSIDDAIRLLRELPGRESSAVREAVQKTLEFMNVDLERLVEDAANKDNSLETRAASLQREVEQHEALALAARKQIAAIEAERLELDAARSWVLEHRAQNGEPIPLERVVRGTPVHGQGH